MSRPTLIMFYQRNCPTCAILKPKFDQLGSQLRASGFRFEKWDMGARRPSYDAQIKTIPSFRLEYECGGQLVAKYWGAKTWDPKTFAADLESWVTRTAGKCPVKARK